MYRRNQFWINEKANVSLYARFTKKYKFIKKKKNENKKNNPIISSAWCLFKCLHIYMLQFELRLITSITAYFTYVLEKFMRSIFVILLP